MTEKADAPKRKYTEAKRASNIRWDRANIDRMSVALPKGSRERVKAHAESRGESVNHLIARALEETMERDNAAPPPGE